MTVSLPDLLDLLNYNGELVQIAHKSTHRPFSATVVDHCQAQAVVNSLPAGDTWFGVNPVREVDSGRPGAADVTRLAGLWVDLDVKPAGCPSWEIAQRIIDELAAMLGVLPVAVTDSGHGLQPIWAIDDAPIVEHGAENDQDWIPRDEARALLRRWGRLVAAVAERFGSRVDTVFDLPRILRVPGTVNYKAAPVAVSCTAAGGAPVTVERVLEVLDEFGVEDRPEDHDDPGTIVAPPAEWRFAEVSCGYAVRTISKWQDDNPNDRHPWLVAQATRIAAMHRHGCLSERDHERAVAALVARFHVLLGRDGRQPGRGEVSDAIGWGQQRVAAMTDPRLAEELGGHQHKGVSDERASAGTLPSVPDAGVDRSLGRLTLRELMRQAEASEAASAVQAATVVPDLPVVESAEAVALRHEVEDQARRLRIRTEAMALERQRQAGDVKVPKPVRATEFLARPRNPVTYRVGGLLRTGGRVVLSAQFKSGKSVMMGNLLRSLADGDPFLGVFTVAVPAGRIALVDDELDEDTLQDWLQQQGIRNLDKIDVISLRGRVATFDLTNEALRAQWAANLKEANCGFLIFDCLRPVLDAIGLSEDKESGPFLVALDALALEAGITEMAVVHHMGHAAERSRGDSRLRDWPDAEWKIVRENRDEDDPAAPRYFSAFGRDVDIKEGRLELTGKRLEFKAGERRQKGRSKAEPDRIPVEPAIEDVLRSSTKPLSKSQIELALRTEGHAQKPIRDALERLIEGGLIKVQGKGRALLCEWTG